MDSAAKEFIAEKIRDKEPNKLKQDKETSNSMEVDLHIHEIVEDTSGLSDGEILDIQLRRFQMALETALIGKVKKVVFIHGVGQGKLKYEITRILHDKYPDLKYQDASFKEYGYGATMILL
jgi:dsDNA-specific endonuclease/ATPase MutS2